MIQPPESQKAAQLVQKAFPQSKLLRIWPLSGGVSAGMTALEIHQPDGHTQKVIVRSQPHPGTAEKEYRLLRLLQAHGLKTPAPYLLDLTATAPALVIDYSEGEMTFTPADLNSHLRQMAAQLAQIHRLDLSPHDLSFLPKTADACLELGRERPFPSPTFPQETQIRQAVAKHNLLPPNKPALLHGDFWPGNCLWRDGELTAVIDWEDAQLGDPLVDLAQSRSEIAWIFGPEAVETFTNQYQQQMPLDFQPLDLQPLPYRDLCAALRQIRLVGEDLAGFADYFAGYGRSDITPQSIRQNLSTFINNAFARLAH